MTLIINFSGGKDSSAMLAYLCDKHPDLEKHVVYADTGWEHEGTEEWCRQIVSGFGLQLHVVRSKTKTLLTMSEKRGKFPGMKQRQCTSDLKRDPIMTWIRQNIKDSLVINCLGIRSEESSGRSKAAKLKRNKRQCNSIRTIWDWAPIKDWKETEVRNYLKEKGIPLHPVYDYLRRFSCRVCIFMTEHDLAAVKKNDPAAIDIISRIEDKIGFTMFQKGAIKTII